MSGPDHEDIAAPLVVDLDGTLIRSDLLLESFWKGMGTDPVGTLLAVLRNLHDRPALKVALAGLAPPDVNRIPADPDIVAFVNRARNEGRRVVLASGSAKELVEAAAGALGPFAGAYGTVPGTNLTAAAKAGVLEEAFGKGGFDYIGDSAADIPVWRSARKAYVARPGPRMMGRIDAAGLEVIPIGSAWKWSDLLTGLRPHQWLKNTLLLLPLIAAHRLDMAGVLSVLLGMICFSALASAIYIINDLTDIEADRTHEYKQYRVFAAGTVPIMVGMRASLGLGGIGLLASLILGWDMLAVLLVYLATTLAYSLRLKRVRWVDVTTLAGLYTLRVVAGAVAAGVVASGWLIALVFPVFLALGCVKRLSELARARSDDYLPGRRYRPADRGDLLNVSIIGAIGAVGIMFAYSLSGTAAALYDFTLALWLVALLLGGWLTRMIWTGWTGTQAYDPIIFALTDRIGISIIVASFATLILAAN